MKALGLVTTRLFSTLDSDKVAVLIIPRTAFVFLSLVKTASLCFARTSLSELWHPHFRSVYIREQFEDLLCLKVKTTLFSI